MDNKLNILQKIQKARCELQKKEIKKSGFNPAMKFKYFELEDFLPYVNEICNELMLYTEFQFDKELATLKIFNSENMEEVRMWSTPVDITTLRGGSGMQNIGATQKYSRRYLYMMAFELSESDVIDSENAIDTDAEEGKKRISKAHVITINKLIDETNTDLETFLKWTGVKKVEDITNEAVGTCINMLNKKKEQLEKSRKELMRQKENEFKAEDIVF